MKHAQVSPVFVDWVTFTQHHSFGGLPFFLRGLQATYDASGNCRFERTLPASLSGSFSTALSIGCDGALVYLSGNVGRHGRQDNLFNLDWPCTVAKTNRILEASGLPVLSIADRLPNAEGGSFGARLHRVDLTCNFSSGSEAAAGQVIDWLASRSVSRVKRGRVGNQSVMWANSRKKFTAYVKHLELIAHGLPVDHPAVVFARDNGIVRVEVQLRRRLLAELGLRDLAEVTHEKLEAVYKDQTAIMREVERTDTQDVLEALPAKTRMYAALWLAGQDLMQFCNRSQLYVHAKRCRAFGWEIMEPRNIKQFPVKVRVIDLKPCVMPDWYDLKVDAA